MKALIIIAGVLVVGLGGYAIGNLTAPSEQVIVEIPGEVEVPGRVEIREVVVEVPGPERIVEVEVVRQVLGPERIVERQVIVEVPAVVEPNDLVIQGVTRTNRISDWLGLVGEVLNTGNAIAEFVVITATFYGANGDVVCTNETLTSPDDINPGETAPFELFCTDDDAFPLIDSWKLVVTSRG